jgi:hypothetical protein
VLYHAHETRSKAEVSAQQAAKDEAARVKAVRRQQQEENVRRKEVGVTADLGAAGRGLGCWWNLCTAYAWACLSCDSYPLQGVLHGHTFFVAVFTAILSLAVLTAIVRDQAPLLLYTGTFVMWL